MAQLNDVQKKQILRLALYAGEIMLKNGAETYRVEDTITRICKSKQLKHISAFVTPTVIIISDDRFDGYSFIKRIKFRSTNLNKVAMINDFSREFIMNNFDIWQGIKELKKIDKSPSYKTLTKMIWAGLASGMFALIFGGKISDFIVAFFISMLAMISFEKLERLSETSFLANAAASFIIGMLAIIVRKIGFGNSLDMVIVGSIMPLLPGVALTNGIRDFISGDLISGVSRVSEALLTAIAIAVGIGSALKLLIMLGGVI